MATATLTDREAATLVTYRKDGNIAVLELNDPPANTYTHEMMRQLDECILRARFDNDVQVIIVRGAGNKFFSAGANIKMLNEVDPTFKYYFCLHANETLSRLEIVRIVRVVVPWRRVVTRFPQGRYLAEESRARRRRVGSERGQIAALGRAQMRPALRHAAGHTSLRRLRRWRTIWGEAASAVGRLLGSTPMSSMALWTTKPAFAWPVRLLGRARLLFTPSITRGRVSEDCAVL